MSTIESLVKTSEEKKQFRIFNIIWENNAKELKIMITKT